MCRQIDIKQNSKEIEVVTIGAVQNHAQAKCHDAKQCRKPEIRSPGKALKCSYYIMWYNDESLI